MEEFEKRRAIRKRNILNLVYDEIVSVCVLYVSSRHNYVKKHFISIALPTNYKSQAFIFAGL